MLLYNLNATARKLEIDYKICAYFVNSLLRILRIIRRFPVIRRSALPVQQQIRNFQI